LKFFSPYGYAAHCKALVLLRYAKDEQIVDIEQSSRMKNTLERDKKVSIINKHIGEAQ